MSLGALIKHLNLAGTISETTYSTSQMANGADGTGGCAGSTGDKANGALSNK